ncbi:MAG: tRNA adenosine(34) deaminase TadA [Pseudomonadota bacterium]
MTTHQETWMRRALELAAQAAKRGEVPVGALVIDPQGDVIAEAHNAPIIENDPTAHAEVLALRHASRALGNYRLTGCTLVVTLEPCAMCAGAISTARITHLIYGASDQKGGAIEHGPRLFEQPTIHHRPKVTSGVLADEAARLLREFFAARRR